MLDLAAARSGPPAPAGAELVEAQAKWVGRAPPAVLRDDPGLAATLDALAEAFPRKVRLMAAMGFGAGDRRRLGRLNEIARHYGTRLLATGDVLYVLDEPTTGLHLDDVKKLLGVLNRLVDAGNTVLVVEHHLDVVKCADHVVDLGPEGGDAGGEIVAEGPPEQIMQTPGSYTGKFLTEGLPKTNGKR